MWKGCCNDNPACQGINAEYIYLCYALAEEPRNFFPRLFDGNLKFVRKNIFVEVQFLLLPFVKKVISCAFYLHSQQGRRFSAYLCVSWSTKACSLPLHRTTVIL
jgi:hypothetical protein